MQTQTDQDGSSVLIVTGTLLDQEVSKGVRLDRRGLLDDEIETLKYIHQENMRCGKRVEIEIFITEDLRATVVALAGDNYPEEVPVMSLEGAVGLDDEQKQRVVAKLQGLASHKKGYQMIHSLICHAKEFLKDEHSKQVTLSGRNLALKTNEITLESEGL